MLTDHDIATNEIQAALLARAAGAEKPATNRPNRKKDAGTPSGANRRPAAAGGAPPTLYRWEELRACKFSPDRPLFIAACREVADALLTLDHPIPITYIPESDWTRERLQFWFRELGVTRAIYLGHGVIESETDEEYAERLQQERTLVAPFTDLGVEHCADPRPVVVELTGGRMETAASLVSEDVEWLWPKRIARGKLTILAGDGDVGKSFMSIDVAARASSGLPWPDGEYAEPGRVVVLSGEDGITDTILPRFEAMGGDRRLLVVLTKGAVELHRDLETIIRETDAQLVVLDPLSAFLPGLDSHKEAAVRRALTPLVEIAARTDAAILAIGHLTKSPERPGRQRIQGSAAFRNIARTSVLMTREGERSVAVWEKNNLLMTPPSALAFALADSKVVWDTGYIADEVAHRIREGEGAGGSDPSKRDAEDLIRELLADGPRRATEIVSTGRAHGISPATTYRAKDRMGVVQAWTTVGKTRESFWRLP